MTRSRCGSVCCSRRWAAAATASACAMRSSTSCTAIISRRRAARFIEEWHQKLHNNTTPDDVVICEAYLAFLRSDGKLEQFYQTLEAGGVTRERLLSFERPIKTKPEFFPDLKAALIKEFENFLRVLESVHAGTDLETAAAAADGKLESGLEAEARLLS